MAMDSPRALLASPFGFGDVTRLPTIADVPFGRVPALRSGVVAQDQDLAAMARAIIDANLYMVLGTADAAGLPWVSPVYYAPAGYRDFIWVSSPDSRHSQNIQARRDVGIVIFDSSVPIDTGQGV
jgi:Pyridoxamine 5'-phosphate oxidase